MNDEAAQLRRELERYRRSFKASSDRQTGKVLRALMAQIEARLREIGLSTSQFEGQSQLGAKAMVKSRRKRSFADNITLTAEAASQRDRRV